MEVRLVTFEVKIYTLQTPVRTGGRARITAQLAWSHGALIDASPAHLTLEYISYSTSWTITQDTRYPVEGSTSSLHPMPLYKILYTSR